MCNLYRMTKARSEVADWFGAADGAAGANFAGEVYPAYPGLAIAEGQVRAMTWGFPLVLKGKQGQLLKPRPVNNARTDKLQTFFWRNAFAQRRCLIPLTAWAEAQGAKGSMTRTWMSRLDAPLFAVAGVWQPSDEWGACYAMVMTDSAGSAASDVHNRMPVVLTPDDYPRWLESDPDDALGLCQAFAGELAIDRTSQPWTKGAASQPGLL